MVKKYYLKPFCVAAFICSLVFYSGIFRIPQRFPLITFLNNKDIVEISGTIKSSPVRVSSKKFYSAVFEVKNTRSVHTKCQAHGQCNVLIPSEIVEVYFPGKLYSQGFEKGTFLYEQGGFYTFEGFFSNNAFIVNSCKHGEWKKTLKGSLLYVRALCRLHLKRLMFLWKDAGGLLLALICGAREYTEEQTSLAFKNAGLSHILALSGMHLSLISGIAVFLGDRLKNIKLTLILRFIILILFVWFTGFSPSLCRAFICNLLLLIAVISDVKSPDMFNILCVSFLLQAVLFPADIMNTGFILSYAALAGILVTNSFFSRIYLSWCPKIISNSFSASTGAQLFTAPITLKIFKTYCPFGIFASLFVSPLVTCFIYIGLALILLSLLIPPLAEYSAIFMNILYTVIKNLVIFFAKLPSINLNH